MSSTVVGTIALVGAGFVLYALIAIARGQFSYKEGDDSVSKTITRSGRPQTFWLTTLGFLAAGVVLLAVAAFFYRG
jgi:hypothetical protein